MSSESYPFLKKSTEITAQQWGNNPTIGRNYMIEVGSVVTKDTPPRCSCLWKSLQSNTGE